MAAATVTRRCRSLADLLKKLGDIPPERIGLPVGTATEEDVLRHLEAPNKRIYELVDGILVEKPIGMRESMIAGQLVRHLGNYLDEKKRGIPFTADGPIRVRLGRIRIPDAGFISWDRIPGDSVPKKGVLDAAPNLVAEVVSEGNTPKEMLLKLREYFRLGVEVVWYLYPDTRRVVVHTTPREAKTLGIGDVLDGGRVLPGFRVPVAKLFDVLDRPPR